MSEKTQPATNQRAFIDARLQKCRLVTETVQLGAGTFAADQKEIQVTANTTSTFTVSLNDPANPTSMLIEIGGVIKVMIPQEDRILIDYAATHAVEFSINGWTGFSDWTTLPMSAITQYAVIANEFALRRAEGTFAAMAVRGIVLSREVNLDPREESSNPDAVSQGG